MKPTTQIIESHGQKLATCCVGQQLCAGSLTYSTQHDQQRDQQHGQPNQRHPTVVFCGGFKSSMQGTKALALQELCIGKHWPYVRFDYSGHGQSSGDFKDGNIDRWLADALTVIDSIDNRCGVVLVGSSMGAWIATLAALKRPAVIKGLITLAAAPDFTDRLLHKKLSAAQLTMLATGAPVNMPSEYDDGSPYPITQQLIDNSKRHCLLDGVHRLEIPVRMLHGTEDVDVPHTLSMELMDAIQCEDATLTLVKGGDHRLSSAADIRLLATTLNAMLEEFSDGLSN